MVNFTLVLASLFNYSTDMYFTMDNIVYTPDYLITENNINIELEVEFICTFETNLYYDFVVFDDYALDTATYSINCTPEQPIKAEDIHHIQVEYFYYDIYMVLTPDSFEFFYTLEVACEIYGWQEELLAIGSDIYSNNFYEEISFFEPFRTDFNDTFYKQELFNLLSEQEAYNAGYAAGQFDGYNEAMAVGDSIGEMLGGIFEGINAFLSVQLVPGITFGLLALIPIVFGVVQFIMNFWR